MLHAASACAAARCRRRGNRGSARHQCFRSFAASLGSSFNARHLSARTLSARILSTRQTGTSQRLLIITSVQLHAWPRSPTRQEWHRDTIHQIEWYITSVPRPQWLPKLVANSVHACAARVNASPLQTVRRSAPQRMPQAFVTGSRHDATRSRRHG